MEKVINMTAVVVVAASFFNWFHTHIRFKNSKERKEEGNRIRNHLTNLENVWVVGEIGVPFTFTGDAAHDERLLPVWLQTGNPADTHTIRIEKGLIDTHRHTISNWLFVFIT